MKQDVVLLEDVTVTIRELTPRDIQFVMSNLSDLISGGDFTMGSLSGEKYDQIMTLLKRICQVEGKRELDDLGFSEFEKIYETFKEVNSSFFLILGMGSQMAQVPEAEQPMTQGESLTTQ